MNKIQYHAFQALSNIFLFDKHVYYSLNQPLDLEDIKIKLKFINISSKPLVSLFSAYNGNYPTPSGEKINVSSCGSFLALDFAIQRYMSSNLYQKLKIFPILSSEAGTDVCLDFKKDSNSFNRLCLIDNSKKEFHKKIIYDGLVELFKTIEECFNCNAYGFTGGELVVNHVAEARISLKLNPNSIYWIEQTVDRTR